MNTQQKAQMCDAEAAHALSTADAPSVKAACVRAWQ